MIRNTDFYSAYLSNHFQIKARIAAHYLNMAKDDIDKTIEQTHLQVNDIEFIKAIKIDLVQTFYQSIETLFGFMHSLEKSDAQLTIPDYLVKLQPKDLHNYIRPFEDFDFCEDYLRATAPILDNTINNCRLLFYLASIFSNFPPDYLKRIQADSNIKGIALTLNQLAKAFNQEAHNSIKHGLRCVLINELNFNIEVPEDLKEEFDLPDEFKTFNSSGDTLFYYTKEKNKRGATIVLMPIDVKQMIYLEEGLTKLLFNMLHQRDKILRREREVTVTWHTFNFEELRNVEFNDINANFTSIRLGDPE